MSTVNVFTTAGADPNIGGVYRQEWATKLQERLDYPQNWKEVCNVVYSDTKYVNMPYMSIESAAQTGTRGSAYGFAEFTLINDQLNIGLTKIVPSFIDRADLAQCKLASQMEVADRQGLALNEAIETAVLANYASWTTFDGAALGGSAGDITVDINNIDDIIRGLKREIGEANGQALADRNGVFIVWRYADLELLEQFAQAGIKFIGLVKSSLINGEHLIAKAKATLNKAICQLQRLSERTLIMSEATVRTL